MYRVLYFSTNIRIYNKNTLSLFSELIVFLFHYHANIIARDPAEIERSNLVNICKLVVKELLEQSVRYGRMLDSDHLPLQHFFIVIEHVLGHGLRTKKVILTNPIVAIPVVWIKH